MGILTLIIFCVGALKEVWSYSDGAGVRACMTRIPIHGVPAQTEECPYEITVNKRYIYSHEKVQVTINGTRPFRGFMIQGIHKSNRSPLGKFHNSVGGVNMDCGAHLENAISHYNSDNKNSTTVEWEPVRVRADFIEFFATVVYDMNTFWIDLKSQSVYLIENSYGRTFNRRNVTYSRMNYRPYNYINRTRYYPSANRFRYS